MTQKSLLVFVSSVSSAHLKLRIDYVIFFQMCYPNTNIVTAKIICMYIFFQDREGVLYQSEIKALLERISEEDISKLERALELKAGTINGSEEKSLPICRWSRKMGHLARPHLVYHLGRIGLSGLADRCVSM